MSGRTETITLQNGREVPLPPFTFGELDDWFVCGFQLANAATMPPAESWGLVREQVVCVWRAAARLTPELTLEEFRNGLVYVELDTQLFAAVRRVNGLGVAERPPATTTEDGSP
jgi:hypothetical protein